MQVIMYNTRVELTRGNKINQTTELANLIAKNASNAAQNYHEFVQALKDFLHIYKPGRFVSYFDQDQFMVLHIDTKKRVTVVTKYKVESPVLMDYMKKLFALSQDFEIVETCSDKSNAFSYSISPLILDILLAKANIESRGETPFVTFKKVSKNGKVRDITAPDPEIKEPLRNLNTLLQNVYDKENADFQVAYKKGKSILSGAALHTTHKYVFNIDLHNFFPSCKKELVAKYLQFLFNVCWNTDFVADEFYKAILQDDALFIGNPISGTIANRIIASPVAYIKSMAAKTGLTVSVYADDMSFSSDRFIVPEYIVGLFNKAFHVYNLDSYFTLNDKKSIGFTGANRKVTGVSINNKNQITIPGHYWKPLRATIEHLNHGDTNINIQKLRGQIAYALMVDTSGKVIRYLKKFEKTVNDYELVSSETFAKLNKEE